MKILVIALLLLIPSCTPLLVGGLIGGVLVYQHEHRQWCQAPNGVVFRCHPRHFLWHR